MKNEPIELLREIRRHNSSGLTKDMQGRIDAALSQQAEPAVAQSYKDDPRTAAELSAAGCRCVRFGEGNPHWPCRIHAAPAQDERVRLLARCLELAAGFDSRLCKDIEAAIIAEARPAQAEQQPFSPDWVDYGTGFKTGVDEFADEVKQLCKDFSDLQNRPYMGDVTAAIDGLAEAVKRATPIAQPAAAGDERGHDTKGSRKALGAMNAKLRAKVGRLERELAALSAQQSAPDRVSVPVGLLQDLVANIEDRTCTHDSTHRGGAIWEICDDCGDRWADDMGGKPEFKWPDCVEKARALLASSEQEVEL